MNIKTFEMSDLNGAMDALKSAFYHENSRELFNEWEFAKNLPNSDGYVPELCVTALDGGKVVGYNALTKAEIGGFSGLALGPLGVRKEYQNIGIGTALVKECITRAEKFGFPWIALLGGDYYARFGFESGKPYGITVTENEFDNEHLQILFLDPSLKNSLTGKLTYCSAFYDDDGNLL